MMNETGVMPGAPAQEFENNGINLSEIFVLTFRKGGDILTKHFHSPGGDKYKAIERAKLHCERMRIRFLFCVPFIRDLADEESKMEF